MHRLSIPPEIVAQVTRSRGREHIYDALDPTKTALLVVDMQNGFMDPIVGHSVCPMARAIVPNINRIAEAMRASGGFVVWIQNAATEESRASWSMRVEMDGPVGTAKRFRSMTPGSKGYALWPELDNKPGDLYVQKTRFSAFIEGASDLEAQLRARRIENVVVTGTVTNICCESTARDAMMRNFRTIMVSDANAAMNDEMHNAALTAFYVRFGDVMASDFLIGVLQTGSAARAAAQ